MSYLFKARLADRMYAMELCFAQPAPEPNKTSTGSKDNCRPRPACHKPSPKTVNIDANGKNKHKAEDIGCRERKTGERAMKMITTS